MDALGLLSGDPRTFVEKVWAHRAHLHHCSPADSAALLSLDDVDHLLTSTGLRTPALRMAQDGAVIASSRYTRAATLAGVPLTVLVDPVKVFDLMDGGATIVLQGLHRYWEPISELVRDLEVALGHPCQANAYLTPPGSQGFALHSDTHDVFVLQTHGSKRWEVHDENGPQHLVLDPGTSLYLPRGTPHAAHTESAVSLHVSVGVNLVTWRELIDRVVKQVLTGAELDQPIPAGYLDDPQRLQHEVGHRMAALAAGLADLDPAAVAGDQVRHFLRTRRPALRGGLHDRLNLAAVNDETLLERRPGSICVVQPDGDRLLVLLGDRELRVPARLAGALRYVRAQPHLRALDLAPWLDPQSRLVLVRRLLREALFQVHR
ncbi:hypothetical protein BH24ACT11_BH24ACT11_20610 [soil metagenome]